MTKRKILMTKTASMPTSRAGGLRNLFLILCVEIAFVVGLHYLGSLDRMQIDFGNFSKWLDTTPPEIALSASIRMLALVIAYWVLATSAVYIFARAFKIPGILQAMEFATLPFVRKAIDGALAATIIGGTVFGGASAVFAKTDASKVSAPTNVTTSVKDFRHLYNPTAAEDGPAVTPISSPSASTDGELRVVVSQPNSTPAGAVTATPSVAPGEFIPVPAEDISNPPAKAETPVVTPAPAETPVTTLNTAPKVIVPDNPSTTELPVTSSTPKTTTPAIPTTTPKVTTPTTQPTPQPIPSPGVVIGGEKVQRPNDTPQTPVTTPVETSSSTSYTVVNGDNFWNIAKVQLEKNLGRPASNSEVANYWVKLIDANKGNIRSGDASLIFAGEVFTLPTV